MEGWAIALVAITGEAKKYDGQLQLEVSFSDLLLKVLVKERPGKECDPVAVISMYMWS